MVINQYVNSAAQSFVDSTSGFLGSYRIPVKLGTAAVSGALAYNELSTWSITSSARLNQVNALGKFMSDMNAHVQKLDRAIEQAKLPDTDISIQERAAKLATFIGRSTHSAAHVSLVHDDDLKLVKSAADIARKLPEAQVLKTYGSGAVTRGWFEMERPVLKVPATNQANENEVDAVTLVRESYTQLRGVAEKIYKTSINTLGRTSGYSLDQLDIQEAKASIERAAARLKAAKNEYMRMYSPTKKELSFGVVKKVAACALGAFAIESLVV